MTCKPIKLMGTARWSELLRTKRTIVKGKLVSWRLVGRRMRVTGKHKQLQASANYPPRFGHAVATLLKAHLSEQLKDIVPRVCF